jgi:hypothetical protein
MHRLYDSEPGRLLPQRVGLLQRTDAVAQALTHYNYTAKLNVTSTHLLRWCSA